MITTEEAEEIRQAFGPGSTMYVMDDASQVAADCDRFPTVRGYIENEVLVEEVLWDCVATAGNQEIATRTDPDGVTFFTGLKERTEALMARKGW